MDIRHFLKIASKQVWILVLFAILGGIISYIAVQFATPTYEAESALYIINNSKFGANGGGLNEDESGQGQILGISFAAIINSHQVSSKVLTELNEPNISESELKYMTNVYIKKNSNIMTINTVWNDPKIATLINRITSKVFVEKINEITMSKNISILDEEQTPIRPIPNGITKIILTGTLIGLAIGFSIAYFREFFNTTIQSIEEIENTLKLKVIGVIPENTV